MTKVLKFRSWLSATLCTATITLTLVTTAPVSYATTYAEMIRLKMADFFRLDSEHARALVYNRSNRVFLFETSDAGANWTAFLTPFVLRHIFFLDGNKGWGIAGERNGQAFRTFCVRTSDSGRTWSRLGSFDSSVGQQRVLPSTLTNMGGLCAKATWELLSYTKLLMPENIGTNWVGTPNQLRVYAVCPFRMGQLSRGLPAQVAAEFLNYVPEVCPNVFPTWKR